jgi:hypothetical protein
MDSCLKLNYRGRTIDTTTTAKIKVVVVGANEKRLGAPPVLVNKQVAAADGLLFVQSNLRADNDAKDVLDNASIVDVYGLQDGRYKFSFHVFDYDGKKMSSFLVADNLFIAVLGDHLQSFEIQRDVFGLF